MSGYLTAPPEMDIYDFIESRIASGSGIPYVIKHKGCLYLAKPIFPQDSEGSLVEDIGFTLSADGNRWERCSHCKGVGRLDCCDDLSCEKCNGLFTRICENC